MHWAAMKLLCLKGIFIISILGVVSTRELYVKIAPDTVYLDTTDVFVTCVFNSQTVKSPIWMTITRNGWFGKQKIITMTPGNPPIVGKMFTSSNYSSRMTISGSIMEKRVNILFKTMDCLDEAHYECDAGGFTDQGGLVQFQDSNALEVLSHPEPPSISINGVFVASMTENHVTEGSFVKVECDAHVGKPPQPMFWFKYNTSSHKYLLEQDLITRAERRLPENELCRWYTRFGLNFNATLSEPEVRVRCVIGHHISQLTIKIRRKIVF